MIHGRYYQSLEFSWVVWNDWSGIPQITYPQAKIPFIVKAPGIQTTQIKNYQTSNLGDYSGIDNVDGKNPAPVDMLNISLFTRFYTSQVVQVV